MNPNDDEKQQKYPLEIIEIGFLRSGTASLGNAIEILGKGPVWHTINNKFSLTLHGLQYWVKKHKMDRKLLNNDKDSFQKFNEWLYLISCPTIMDVPIALHWEKVFKWYPNCKVILVVRDYDEWHKSIMINIDGIFFSNWFQFFAKFLHAPQWCDFYAKSYFNQFDIYNKINCKIKYDQYITRVKQIVPANQLLIYNIKDEWRPLCKFLDCPIPKNTEFPHTNKGGPKFKRKIQILLMNYIIFKSVPWILMCSIGYFVYYLYRRRHSR